MCVRRAGVRPTRPLIIRRARVRVRFYSAGTRDALSADSGDTRFARISRESASRRRSPANVREYIGSEDDDFDLAGARLTFSSQPTNSISENEIVLSFSLFFVSPFTFPSLVLFRSSLFLGSRSPLLRFLLPAVLRARRGVHCRVGSLFLFSRRRRCRRTLPRRLSRQSSFVRSFVLFFLSFCYFLRPREEIYIYSIYK